MLGQFETDTLPGPSRVGRLVYPVTMMGLHAPRSMLTHTHIHHIRVAFRYSDGSNGPCFEIPVGDVMPGDPHVICLPEPAPGSTHVVGGDISGNAAGSHRSPAPKRTDGTPFHGCKVGIMIDRNRNDRFLGLCPGRQRGKEEQESE